MKLSMQEGLEMNKKHKEKYEKTEFDKTLKNENK